jgi:hypothetical protein
LGVFGGGVAGDVGCGVAVGEVADVPSNNYRRESEEK